MTNFQALTNFGWNPFFQQQLSVEEWQDTIPARITEQHKSVLELVTDASHISIQITPAMPHLVVGDWVLLDQSHQFIRLLDRKTCFKRKSPGSNVAWQLISANVDTAFIVSSMNDDFNLSRIERYLALVKSVNVEPVLVLTKSDRVDDPDPWKSQAQRLDPLLPVVAINALDAHCQTLLADWIAPGKTCVLLGSSGVGKSTLTNSLLGYDQRTATLDGDVLTSSFPPNECPPNECPPNECPQEGSLQKTFAIRENDQKGRHTTTRRSLISTENGAMLLDTPGMRELQIADCQDGIASTFEDIERLALNCNFSNCQHQQEPDCAVLAAVESGELDARRFKNYQKLLKEEQLNSSSLAEKRAKDKNFGKFIKRTLKDSYKLKGRQ